MSQSQWCSQCGVNEHKFSCKCSSAEDDSSSVGSGIGADEIMLFGVRVKVDPMRKSVSMNNLSQYEQPASAKRESSNNNFDGSAAAADNGYASADDALRNQSNGTRERKRGIPWSEDEHKLFLIGLQKVGKGDWRGISRNFVKTRTPTQVASHAQKYFLRQCNLNGRRRRSSLFDLTADSVSALPTEENQVNKDNKGQAVVHPSMAFSHSMSSINGGSTLLVHPTPNQSTRMDPNINRKYETDPLPVSLNLSLSFNPDRSSSSYQVISGFSIGDSMISVN